MSKENEKKNIVDAAPDEVKITDAETNEETKSEGNTEEAKGKNGEAEKTKSPWRRRILYGLGIGFAAAFGGAVGWFSGSKAGFAKGKKASETLPEPSGFEDSAGDSKFGGSSDEFGGFGDNDIVSGQF